MTHVSNVNIVMKTCDVTRIIFQLQDNDALYIYNVYIRLIISAMTHCMYIMNKIMLLDMSCCRVHLLGLNLSNCGIT